jgi:hypothetical protein
MTGRLERREPAVTFRTDIPEALVNGTPKRAGVVAVLALLGYFLVFPGLALLTGGAEWDGNGPRYEENGLGDTFFWLMMASFAVCVVSGLVAFLSGMIRLIRRGTTAG